jgi:hypothetical protein
MKPATLRRGAVAEGLREALSDPATIRRLAVLVGPVAKGRRVDSRPEPTPEAVRKAIETTARRHDHSDVEARALEGQVGLRMAEAAMRKAVQAGNQPNPDAFTLPAPSGMTVSPARAEVDAEARRQLAAGQGTVNPNRAGDGLYGGFAGGPGTDVANYAFLRETGAGARQKAAIDATTAAIRAAVGGRSQQ